uniref:riboflavin kinase n=1 Tax=Xenopsylla cheopis TaxID=163159 RepID=A0A6M2DGC7_XENCH
MPSVANESAGGGDHTQISFSVAKTSAEEKAKKGKVDLEGHIQIISPPSTSISDISFTRESSDDDTEGKDSSLENILAERERNKRIKAAKKENVSSTLKVSKEIEEQLKVDLVKSLTEKHSKHISPKKIIKIQYKHSDLPSTILGKPEEQSSGASVPIEVKNISKDPKVKYPETENSKTRIRIVENREIEDREIEDQPIKGPDIKNPQIEDQNNKDPHIEDSEIDNKGVDNLEIEDSEEQVSEVKDSGGEDSDGERKTKSKGKEQRDVTVDNTQAQTSNSTKPNNIDIEEIRTTVLQAHTKPLERDITARTLSSSDLPPVPLISFLDVSVIGGTYTAIPDEKALSQMNTVLPYFVRGRVATGFGRGSKDLGVPTANFSREVVKTLHMDLCPGVYFGWAKIDKWPVMKMVMNLGWNPFYDNKEKSLEVHVMYEFPFDFYGSFMRICILGYMRPEAKFKSLGDLIRSIKRDKEVARNLLDRPECLMYSMHEFFGCDCNEER